MLGAFISEALLQRWDSAQACREERGGGSSPESPNRRFLALHMSETYVFGTADDQRHDYRGCVTACGRLRSSRNSGGRGRGRTRLCQSSHAIDCDDHKLQLSPKNMCGSSGCQRFSWLLAVSDCLWFPVAAWGVVACGSPWLLGLSGCGWLLVAVVVEWLCVVRQ